MLKKYRMPNGHVYQFRENEAPIGAVLIEPEIKAAEPQNKARRPSNKAKAVKKK